MRIMPLSLFGKALKSPAPHPPAKALTIEGCEDSPRCAGCRVWGSGFEDAHGRLTAHSGTVTYTTALSS